MFFLNREQFYLPSKKNSKLVGPNRKSSCSLSLSQEIDNKERSDVIEITPETINLIFAFTRNFHDSVLPRFVGNVTSG